MSSYIRIATQTLTSQTGFIEFSSIPSSLEGKTLRDLVVVASFSLSSIAPVYFQFNNSSSSVNWLLIAGTGTTTRSAAGSESPGRLGDQIISGQAVINVLDYRTSKQKTVITRIDDAANRPQLVVNRWGETSAITTLNMQVGNAFLVGSTFTLYGIEG